MNRFVILAALAVAILGSPSLAQPAVVISGGTSASTATVVSDPNAPGKWLVDLYANDSGAFLRVYSPAGTDRISTLTVHATQSAGFIVQHSDPQYQDTRRVLSIDSILASTGFPSGVTVTCFGAVVDESIGAVALQQMNGTLTINGNLLGPVSVASTGAAKFNAVTAFGSILGDVAVSGAVGNLLAGGGTIGIASHPIVITADNIGSIHSREINATVTASQFIQSFWAQRSGGGPGHFRGSVTTPQFKQAVRIDGTMFGSLTVGGTGNLALASCSSLTLSCPEPTCNCDSFDLNDVSIRVGESFGASGAPASISIGGDIKSQIIFNDRNLSGQTYNGSITAKAASGSPVTVSAAEYTQTAAALGGGGAGLVPFPAHLQSCRPVHGSTASGANVPKPTNPIVDQHYSHVRTDATGAVNNIPVTVGRRVYDMSGGKAE